MMAKNDVGGSSTVNLKLLMDNIRNGTFNDATGTPYPVQNLKHNLANTDILLLAGTQDTFSQPQDVDKLEALLPADKVTRYTFKDYNHLDYMWAKDCDTVVNKSVYKFLGE